VIGACLAAIFGVSVVALLETMGAPGSGMIARTEQALLSNLVSFTLIAALLGSFIDAMRVQAVEVLGARRTRERELELLSRRLEQSVRERTADLEIALAALEQRAAESERLLAENQGQREAIRALSVPVLPLGGRTLVMPLVGELDGPRLEAVQAQALSAVEQQAARRLLLDITGVPLIDTYVAQSLLRTLTAARLLGAEVILVGVRPEVAQAMVGLGIDLGGLRTFADLQSALR
jgi:rsbT co-antagonist protein RsbR